MLVKRIKMLKTVTMKNEITSQYLVVGEELEFPFKNLEEYVTLLNKGMFVPATEIQTVGELPILEPIKPEPEEESLYEQLELTGNLDALQKEEEVIKEYSLPDTSDTAIRKLKEAWNNREEIVEE